jgi:hypothetical protein
MPPVALRDRRAPFASAGGVVACTGRSHPSWINPGRAKRPANRVHVVGEWRAPLRHQGSHPLHREQNSFVRLASLNGECQPSLRDSRARSARRAARLAAGPRAVASQKTRAHRGGSRLRGSSHLPAPGTRVELLCLLAGAGIFVSSECHELPDGGVAWSSAAGRGCGKASECVHRPVGGDATEAAPHRTEHFRPLRSPDTPCPRPNWIPGGRARDGDVG